MQTTFFEINIFFCQYLCQPLPAEECTSNIFEDATSGTNVPKQYVPAVEKVSSICSLRMSNSYWKYSIIKPVFRGPLNIPEKVSLHHRCLFITGSIPEHGADTSLFWENVPWSEGVLSSDCPLKTGFTVLHFLWLSYILREQVLGNIISSFGSTKSKQCIKVSDVTQWHTVIVFGKFICSYYKYRYLPGKLQVNTH